MWPQKSDTCMPRQGAGLRASASVSVSDYHDTLATRMRDAGCGMRDAGGQTMAA